MAQTLLQSVDMLLLQSIDIVIECRYIYRRSAVPANHKHLSVAGQDSLSRISALLEANTFHNFRISARISEFLPEFLFCSKIQSTIYARIDFFSSLFTAGRQRSHFFFTLNPKNVFFLFFFHSWKTKVSFTPTGLGLGSVSRCV